MTSERPVSSIYFYCRPYASPDKAGYQHAVVALGEGLKELGVSIYSNVPYWRMSTEKDEHLFNPVPGVNPSDCDAVVVSSPWFDYGGELPRELAAAGRRARMIHIDQSDGLVTDSWKPGFRAFDVILKTHFNRKLAYPSNCRPWAFGLTGRMIRETEQALPFEQRRRAVLSNFRHNHQLRRLVNRELIPRLRPALEPDQSTDSLGEEPSDPWQKLQWAQTGRRHYASYYRRLCESAACACFGGCFVTAWPRNPAAWLAQRLNALIADRGFRPHAISQFDSFRLWESLAAGCLMLHVDFEEYGILLPEMPVNGKHYLGVCLDNMSEAAAAITKQASTWAEVATAGREWALAHYGPRATAERFLGLLGLRAG